VPGHAYRIRRQRKLDASASLSWVNAANELQSATRIFPQHVDSYAGASFVDDVRGLAVSRPASRKAPTAGTCFSIGPVTLNHRSFVPSPEDGIGRNHNSRLIFQN